MFIIIQYSRGNTLFYLRNQNEEPINSRVVAIPSKDYKSILLSHIEELLIQTNNETGVIDYIFLEMNEIESLNVNAVCEVSRYLTNKLHADVIVTNNIETIEYNKYLK
ncbi:hypothetical protein [Staphylococcus caeli]|uniref:Uncharacterized protein n=1 Tax=Staphylococcus caeli TaxID=2201815 RepID=A0A1D4SFX5_9STAP|nr:hypothetical protein [Staphylococcus caeli]SCS63058.1 Uncharacterised protein [Staphylococcus caeli]SCT58664.1 Uncharacterised protein [Staphylococcus caeli]